MNSLIKETLQESNYIKWYGRTYYDPSKDVVTIYNTASGFMIKTDATNLTIKISGTNFNNFSLVPIVQVIIDGNFKKPIHFYIFEELKTINLPLDGKMHYIELYKQSEAIRNHLDIHEINVDKELYPVDYHFDHVAEVIGDSTIAGYGNLGSIGEEHLTVCTDGLQDFSFLALKHFNTEVHANSSSGWGVYASLWTTPMEIKVPDFKDKVAVLTDIPWDYKKINPELVIFSLGTNDMTYVYQKPELYEERLAAFKQTYIDFVEDKIKQYPKAKIILLYGICKEVRTTPHLEDLGKTLMSKYPQVLVKKLDGDNTGVSGHPCLAKHYSMADELIEIIKNHCGW